MAEIALPLATLTATAFYSDPTPTIPPKTAPTRVSHAAITDECVEDFRKKWNQMSREEKQDFFSQYTPRCLADNIGGTLFYDYNNLHTYSRRQVDEWRKECLAAFNGGWSNFKHARTETPRRYSMRLFFLMNNSTAVQGLLKHLRSEVEFSMSFDIDSGWGGGCSTKHYYLDEGFTQSRIIKKLTKKVLDSSLEGFKKTVSGTSSGYVLSVPTKLYKKFPKSFSDYREVFETSKYTIMFKSTLSVEQQKKVEEGGLEHDVEPIKSFKKGTGNGRLCVRQDILKNFNVYSGFLGTSSSIPKTGCFTDTNCEYDVLVLRDYGGGSPNQVEYNRLACEHYGFKPFFGDDMKLFLNSCYLNETRWILPMFRKNPHFERDK